ncbi:MAG: MFS transporter, partial [Alphaproteobacteria bacterium]
ILLAVREPEKHRQREAPLTFFGGFRNLGKQTKRVLAVGFLLMLARFSEGFLVLRGIDMGLSPGLSPLALVLFNLGFMALAYPAGALSDSRNPRSLLAAGMAVLIAGNLVLAQDWGMAGLATGVLLWGAHMALTQGILARMVADSAPEPLRATSFGAFYFVTGIATLLASVAAGLIWDREGAAATFIASAMVAGVAWAMLTLLPEDRSAVG